MRVLNDKHNPINKTQDRITASLEIGETINPVLVRAALEQTGVVLCFDGKQYRAFETGWVGFFSAGSRAARENLDLAP
jgi:hypothetical protein